MIYYEEEYRFHGTIYRALKGLYVKSDETVDETFLLSGRCEPKHVPVIRSFEGMIDHLFDSVNDDLYLDDSGYLVGKIKQNATIGLHLYALTLEGFYEEHSDE